MNKSLCEWMYRGFCIAASDYVFLSAFDNKTDSDMQTTTVFQYTSDDGDWAIMPLLKWRFASIAKYKINEGYIIIMSEDGEVFFSGNEKSFTEKIINMAICDFEINKYGYMSDVQQIGEHIYACGASGQVYKRIGPDEWIHMDEGLLQHPDTPSDTEDRHWLTCIRGISEDQIYVVGDWGLIYYWNGKIWTKIDCPERKALNRIYIENPDRIWVCGHRGILLLGNYRDGFVNVSPTEELLFTSITMFNGELYLASDQGLYRFEEKQGRMRRVKTDGLKPLHTDSHYIDAKDGVLWSVGIKDIVWTDGKIWHRVDHPDNPPYGTL